MLNYIAAAVAALAVSVSSPVYATVQEPVTVAATCTTFVDGTPTGTEACQVVISQTEDGVVGIGFVMESGVAIYVGHATSHNSANVGAFGTGGDPVPATGRCVSQETTLTCGAVVAGPSGSVTLTVKAVA